MGEEEVTKLVVCLLLVPPLAAQQRDFLTTDEVEQLRLVQEPNPRLVLYVQFGQQRIDLLKQLLAQEKAGRSILIHNMLEDFTNIVDAIDTVTDDALKRKLPVNDGLAAVTEAEKKWVEALREIEQSRPKDIARYQFALEQAIETTSDSLELSMQDLTTRASEVQAREERADKELESMMQPKDIEEKRAAEKKAAETEKKRKAPTLMRKGEVLKERK
jgi:hypothetical protein